MTPPRWPMPLIQNAIPSVQRWPVQRREPPALAPSCALSFVRRNLAVSIAAQASLGSLQVAGSVGSLTAVCIAVISIRVLLVQAIMRKQTIALAVALWRFVCLVQAFQISSPQKSKVASSASASAPATSSSSSSTSKSRVKPIPYIATTSTVEHSRALSQYIRQGDRVLELGTQLDSCTETIRGAIGEEGHGVFVDVKRTETT